MLQSRWLDFNGYRISGLCPQQPGVGSAMGVVINPRGTSGAGKIWLVREVMAAYRRGGAFAMPLLSVGRSRPMGWRLDHPWGGAPLHVIGHYEATRGGTDTIPLADGGLDGASRLAGELAAGGDVLPEGLQLSGDVERTAAMARAQRLRGNALHVLCLDVPVDRCVLNVMARRRAGLSAMRAIRHAAEANQASLASACAALCRSLALLGVPARSQAWTAEGSLVTPPGPAATPASARA